MHTLAGAARDRDDDADEPEVCAYVASRSFQNRRNLCVCQLRLKKASGSAVSAQGDEDVLDNVSYESFCDSEEIRMVFFYPGDLLAAPFRPVSKSRETLRLYLLRESFEKHSGVAN